MENKIIQISKRRFLYDMLSYDVFKQIYNEYVLEPQMNTESFLLNLWEEFGLRYRNRYIYQPTNFMNDLITIIKRTRKQAKVLYDLWNLELKDLKSSLITKNISTSKDSLNTSSYQGSTYFNDLEEDEEGPSTERNYSVSNNYRYSDAVLINRAKTSKFVSGLEEYALLFKELFSVSVYKNNGEIFEEIQEKLNEMDDKSIELMTTDNISDLIDKLIVLEPFQVGLDKYALTDWIVRNIYFYAEKTPIFRTYGKPLFSYKIDSFILGISKIKITYKEDK